jgi:hypothetical protein
MKAFISGRVSGIKYEYAKRNFKKVETVLVKQGYEVVNPTTLCNKEWSWLRCMCVCLWHLSKCDEIYVMRNYKKSKGAKIELRFARLLRKQVFFIDKIC